MTALQEFKLTVVQLTGLSRDALHIYVGLSVLLIAAFVLRKPLQSAVPWLCVVAIATLIELGDMRDDIMSLGYWRWGESLHDFVNTIFWPTVLWLVALRSNLLPSEESGT